MTDATLFLLHVHCAPHFSFLNNCSWIWTPSDTWFLGPTLPHYPKWHLDGVKYFFHNSQLLACQWTNRQTYRTARNSTGNKQAMRPTNNTETISTASLAKLEYLSVYGRSFMGESWLLDYYRFVFLPMFFLSRTETWLLESRLAAAWGATKNTGVRV